MQAAVPKYVGGGFSSAPPGHRYRLYLEYWSDSWGAEKKKKPDALKKVLDMGAFTEEIKAIRLRQEKIAPEGSLVFRARSAAPFVTGMGMEHPMENGFAFLDPYGLPYLPGSSVKGAVRRAAEELALFEEDSQGWTIPAVWWLFGFDGSSGFFKNGKNGEAEAIREERERWQEAYAVVRPNFPSELLAGPLDVDFDDAKVRRQISLRGSIDFWDVVPVPNKAKMKIELMNPHFSKYYQAGGRRPEAPGDWGDPVQIYFLALPAGSEFSFFTAFNPVGGLPDHFLEEEQGEPRWKLLIAQALEHAFRWLGFGAKTSQGFGQMQRDQELDLAIETEKKRVREEKEKEARIAEERRIEEEEHARLDALSLLERALEELKDADHDDFISVFNLIDNFGDDDKKLLALQLRSWMQANDQWKVKKKSKKKDRVSKIKTILGGA